MSEPSSFGQTTLATGISSAATGSTTCQIPITSAPFAPTRRLCHLIRIQRTLGWIWPRPTNQKAISPPPETRFFKPRARTRFLRKSPGAMGIFCCGLAEIKHAVEADPKRGAAAFALCMRFEPDVHAVLERVLPHSQAAYISVISALSEQQQTDQALIAWSSLAALHPHLDINESYPLLGALVHKRQMTEAQRVWGQALAFAGVSRPQDLAGSLVWDGGFESNVVVGGLTWYYPSLVGGVMITLDRKEKHSGNRSLRLTFNGLRNVNFSDVCQYVAVEPSTSYWFSAWVRTQGISTDQGVRFGLHSVGDSENSIAWTEDVRGTQPWTQVKFLWTSGSDVRELQLCVSRLPSAKFDSKIGGSAWIDDVALVPRSAENTK